MALSGIRVLELAGAVGVAYAAKLLADLGADVVRVESERDVVRGRPHQIHRWLNTSKRSVSSRFDAAGVDRVVGADLLLHDLTPSAALAAGLDYPTLAAAHPALVVTSITPFGMSGPWAEWSATELGIIHGSSWGYLSPAAASDADQPPLKAPGHHATILTATVAAAAALAAVDAASVSGRGEHVDFSMFAAGARMTETAPVNASFLGNDASRLGVRTVVPWSIYQCRDGLMQFICVEESQWSALVALMGNPEWAGWEVFATNADRRQNADLLELYVGEWMAEQSVGELYLRGQAARLCMAPVYRMDQLPADQQFAARNFFVPDPDGLVLPRAGFVFDQPWWSLRRMAPEPGQHDAEGWTPTEVPTGTDMPEGMSAPRSGESASIRPKEGAGQTRFLGEAGASSGRPLEGVRVCDFTWIWAGPYCTQLLAHLGADIIRLESPDHLCLFRRLPFNPPELAPSPDTNGLFQLYNSDKRSVGIDLGHPDAAEVVRRLVASSDVVVENFAVGTLANLGYTVASLRAINPDIIVVSLTGFGQDGPSADYMAYGPSGGAVAGLYAANGYPSGRSAETGIAIGDPGTGLTAAFATVASLVARRRGHGPARVDVAMVEAIAATVGELWMQYQSENIPPGPAGNTDPTWAPHGVYATAADQWLTIACTTDEQWQALAELGAAGAGDGRPAGWRDPRFETAEGRKSHEAELDELVSAWVAGQDRWELTRRLQAVGVAAVPSVTPLELWTGAGSEQMAAIGMLEAPQHPVTGSRIVPGVPWRLTNGPNGLRRPAPTLGQHTDEVLAELRFTPDEVAALRRSGALTTALSPLG
ncbi:MAG: CoA transferase [Acidimicrobiales bacterium]